MNDVDWISAPVSKAHKDHPSVTDAVSVRIEELLHGQLSEHQLTSKELSELAASLIADMAPISSDAEET